MAAKRKLCGYLRERKGNSAVEFIATVAMLILIFTTLVSALVYVTQYYNASYICRRVVRTIEITGEYDEHTIRALADELGGDALENLDIDIDATYFRGNRIQLRDEFTVHLDAVHSINILMLGSEPVTLDLPIEISLSGRSEVYWK